MFDGAAPARQRFQTTTERWPGAELIPRQIDLVYVAGSMRSGSTLLSEILAQMLDMVAVGELTDVWRALGRDEICSCGARSSRCPLWSAVLLKLQEAYGIGPEDLPKIHAAERALASWRNLPRVIWGYQTAPGKKYRASVRRAEDLLWAIAAASNNRTIVESTKHVQGLLIRRSIPEVRLGEVHLIRDPRAVVNADLRSLRSGVSPAEAPPGRDLIRSTLHWVATNMTLGIISHQSRGIMVEYEALTRYPSENQRWLIEQLSPTKPQPAIGQAGGVSGVHMLVGNPGRHRTQPLSVRVDERWRRELGIRERAVVTALALPSWMLLRRLPTSRRWSRRNRDRS